MLKVGGSILPICVRCSGAVIGILAAIVALLSGMANLDWIIYLPAPAFLDWIIGSRLKGRFWKYLKFVTGILLGFAVPFYYIGVLTLNLPLLVSGVAYLSVAVVNIYLLRKNKE